MQYFLKVLFSLPDRAWFAYLTISLLQLKVIWKIWEYRDLTVGDTSTYFIDAHSWFTERLINIAWSPLYEAFYGTLLFVTTDAYAVTTLHRIIIVFAATLMVLALMRKLLPYSLAWLIAAWWAILPINFNTLYEVHLFSVLPILAAALVILIRPSGWTRGIAIAILFCASFTVRNEFSIATLILAVLSLGWEAWQYVTGRRRLPIWQYGCQYIIPAIIASCVIVFFYFHSWMQFPELSDQMNGKHTLNICQVYAYGYQQRHPEWTGSPWLGCQELMNQTFGQPFPTLFEALRANPSAMFEHFLWNASLSLNGVQLSLFNASSGKVNPDYTASNLNAQWVVLPTLATGIVLITGLSLMYQQRHYWWNYWHKERVWGWTVLLSASFVASFVVIPMQRPRPSYLFSFTLFIMAAIGMSAFVLYSQFIGDRWRRKKFSSGAMLAVVFLTLLFTSGYYKPGERPILEDYRRLMPFRETIAQSEAVFLSPTVGFDLCAYVTGSPKCSAKITSFFSSPFANADSLEGFQQYLDKQKFGFVYLDDYVLNRLEANPNTKALLDAPDSAGWKLVGKQDEGKRWMILRRV